MRRLMIASMPAWCAPVAPAAASLLGQGFIASYRVPDLGTVYADANWSPASFTAAGPLGIVGATVNAATNLAGSMPAGCPSPAPRSTSTATG